MKSADWNSGKKRKWTNFQDRGCKKQWQTLWYVRAAGELQTHRCLEARDYGRIQENIWGCWKKQEWHFEGNENIKSSNVYRESEKSTWKSLEKTIPRKGFSFHDGLSSGASLQRLGKIAVFPFLPQVPNIQQKVIRHTKKQGKMAHSKEQTKSPETDPKETQALNLRD